MAITSGSALCATVCCSGFVLRLRGWNVQPGRSCTAAGLPDQGGQWSCLRMSVLERASTCLCSNSLLQSANVSVPSVRAQGERYREICSVQVRTQVNSAWDTQSGPAELSDGRKVVGNQHHSLGALPSARPAGRRDSRPQSGEKTHTDTLSLSKVKSSATSHRQDHTTNNMKESDCRRHRAYIK